MAIVTPSMGSLRRRNSHKEQKRPVAGKNQRKGAKIERATEHAASIRRAGIRLAKPARRPQ